MTRSLVTYIMNEYHRRRERDNWDPPRCDALVLNESRTPLGLQRVLVRLLSKLAEPTSAASFFSTSATASTTSVLSRGSLPSSEVIGMDKLIASTTRAPAPPNDLRVSSCAHTPPYRPPEAPITASGLVVDCIITVT